MPGSGGLLGRRKASFSTGGKASTGSGTATPGSSNSSSDKPRTLTGVKLTLDSAADDDLDAAGDTEDGGIKINNYSFNGYGMPASAASFPVVGTGSRSKILYQLGEPADLPTPASQQQYSGSRVPFPPLQSTQSSGSLQSQYSPSVQPRDGPPRPRHFRKGSAINHKISLAGLKDFVTTSPVTTPTHLTGVVPDDEKGYVDFPWLRPSSGGDAPISPHSLGPRYVSPQSLPAVQEIPQYAKVPEVSPPPRLRSHSRSNSHLSMTATPPGRQLSAPPNTQTFKIGLPPATNSKTKLTNESPPFSRSTTTPEAYQPISLDNEPFPSGMVTGRSASFPELDGVSERRPSATMPWPISASSSRFVSADPLTDDGQLEEIVPWLYQGADGKRPTSPDTFPTSPRSRNQQPMHNPGTPTSRASGNGAVKTSRSARSATNIRQSERSSSSASLEPMQERERKTSNRFMGMLRKKSSAFVDAVSSSSGRDKDDASPGSSVGTSSRQKLSPREEELYSGRTKRSKKDKKSKESAPPMPRPAVSGFSLDTNLDSMEGIVDMNKNTFALNYSMSNPYEHLNAVTAGNSISPPPPRPGTPPSPSQIPVLGQPALNGVTKKFEFTTTDAAPDLSPLGKRLGLSRKESIDMQVTLQKRPAGAANVLNGPPLPVDTPRKNSLASMITDRRDSEGTINGIAIAPDAGWTAPDSWAVKTTASLAKEEDSDDDDPRAKSDTVAPGSLPPTPLIGGESATMETTASATATGPGKSWRPGVAVSAQASPFAFSRPVMTMASIRIHKSDNSHTTLSLPFNTTVSEMQSMVLKKPGFMLTSSKITSKGYKLYMRANGLERVMAPNEKPLQWQDRKFRAAGYDPDSDRLEDLGREDHSYLCKFILKPEVVPVVRWDEENLESFDFIDLAARGIENLPVFLHKHAHDIISLNVSRNPHLHLPTDFVQACTSLRELKMIEMGMKRIPQSVKEVPGLTRLDLSINRIVELEHCALFECRELTTFNAFNNRLTSLPDYFVHFKTLKYLNISNNRFETFPVVICEVSSLVDLDISLNNISSLPPELGKLKHLETLILFCNNITAFPTTIKLLSRLRRLDCRRNKIADFSLVTSMPNLQSIRAQHNMAKALDLQADSLAILNLSNNPITRFTVLAASNASALTHLDLSHSRLETIPEELFTTCLSLQLLSVNNNKIRSISENVGNLQRLGTLSIKNNVLQSVPSSIGKLMRLHTLDVSSNQLSVLPDTIWQCSELETLNASFNNLVEFPDPSIKPVDKADAAPATTSITPLMSMSLRRLYLAYNRLRDDVLRPLSYMTGLIVLNLSFNDIYEIPNGMLRKCYQLTHLYLSGNMLTSLPADDLERLIHLKVLHLNGNKLQTLPAELGSIHTLQVLDVGSNSLKYNIANWPYDWNWNWNLQLRYLNLSGNKRLEIKPSAQQAQELSPNGIVVKRRNLSDFSALSHLRVLGLMDVTLMIPSVPDESDARRVRTSLSSINEMGYGVADTLGSSEYLSLIDLVVPRFRGKDDECVIGLFDAGMQERPGGAKIVKFVVDHFVQRLTLELSRLRDEDASQGLRRTFLSLNRDWGNTVTLEYDRSRKGSDVTGQGDRINANPAGQNNVRASASAVVVYLYKKTLYVANVGDSMALIAGRTMLARDLTTKHEPCSPEEITRIRSAEGWISTDGLVNDQAKSARAYGAFHVFPAVNCEPTVHVLDLVDSDEFVIVANNGFWSFVNSQMAVDIVWEQKGDPMLAAQKLRDLAIAYGAESSIIVMVVSVGDLFKSRQPLINRGVSKPNGDSNVVYDRPRRPQGSIPGLRIADETAAPQGTVALVFTDIRNSTSLWETNPGMQNAMRIHHELLRRLIRAFDGYEVKTEGDAFMVSFSSVTSAALWAFTVQLELLRADWPAELIMSEEGKELYGPHGELIYRGLSVRMGLHWGAPICEQDPVNHRMDYLGPMVNRASRVSGVAEGGQITASADAVEVLQAMLNASNENEEDLDNPLIDPNQLDTATKRDIAAIKQLGYGIKEIGEHKLKGLETPEFLSLIYPSALIGRLSGGKSKEAMISDVQLQLVKSGQMPAIPVPRALFDYQDVRSLGNLCLRMEALSAGNDHRLYEVPSNTTTSNNNSPAIGYNTSPAAPRRRITLSPHLLSSSMVRPDASEEELLVLLELFVVRIENALSTMQLQQLGPFTDVLAALGDAVRIEPKFILQALTMLSQML